MPKSDLELPQIPGTNGFPLVGDLPRFLPNPLPHLQMLQNRYGNLFYARFAMNRKNVFVLGPELTEQVLVTQADAFSNELGYIDQSKFLGSQVLLFKDGAAHKALRSAINPAFTPDQLRGYLSAMDLETKAQVNAWGREATALMQDINLLTMRIAARSIVGVSIEVEAVAINQHFANMLGGMAGILPAAPGSRKWKGLRSQLWMKEFFQSKIKQRREQLGDDIFSCLCREDVALTDEEIVDNVIGMLAASYETTASAIAMMLRSLAATPEWQHRLRAELSPLLEPGGMTWERIRSCEQTEWVFKETLRLYTPLSYFPRQSIEDLQLAGYAIPANTSITIAPRFVHHMPSIYPEPEKFDPERFSPERAEDTAHRLAWMPFGKGAHTCAGMHFAQMEIFVFFARLLERFQVEEVVGKSGEMNYIPVLKPVRDLPIRLAEI